MRQFFVAPIKNRYRRGCRNRLKSPEQSSTIGGEWDEKTMKKYATITVLLAIGCIQYAQAAEVPFVELKGHTGAVNSAVFSADGKNIVTGSEDGTARIWDAASGKELLKLNIVGSVATFSPDGTKVITSRTHENVQIWDARSGKQIRRLERRRSLPDRFFRSIATVIPEFGNSAVFSADGTKIVTGGHGVIIIWDAETGRELLAMSDADGARAWAWTANFSPNAEKVVTAGHGIRDKVARIWDTVLGKEERRLVGHTGAVNSAVFSADGKKIVTASEDNTARIWDAQSGQELQKLEHARHVRSAAFSPDGKQIVTAGGNIQIFDVESGQELQKLEGHTNSIRSATFSPDGKKIVTGGFPDGTVRIWTLE